MLRNDVISFCVASGSESYATRVRTPSPRCSLSSYHQEKTCLLGSEVQSFD